MSAQPKSLPSTQEEARIVALPATHASASSEARLEEVCRVHPELRECDGELLRLVMEEVDRQIAALDDRVESRVGADHRAAMIADGMKAAQAELDTQRRQDASPHSVAQESGKAGGKPASGKPRKRAKIDKAQIAQKAVMASPEMSAIKREESELLQAEETKSHQPKQKSGTIVAAEEANPDLTSLPPETGLPAGTKVRRVLPDGTVIFMTVAGLAVAEMAGAQLISKALPAELGKLKFENATLRDLESTLFDEADPDFRGKIDKRQAEADKRKEAAALAEAAKEQSEPREGWVGKEDEHRALPQEKETTV